MRKGFGGELEVLKAQIDALQAKLNNSKQQQSDANATAAKRQAQRSASASGCRQSQRLASFGNRGKDTNPGCQPAE